MRPIGGHIFRRARRIGDRHFKCRQSFCNRQTNPPQTDHTGLFTKHPAGKWHRAFLGPGPVTHPFIAHRNFTRLGKQHANREIGDFACQHVRGVGHMDTACLGSGNINPVIADTVIGDDLQIGQRIHILFPESTMPFPGNSDDILGVWNFGWRRTRILRLDGKMLVQVFHIPVWHITTGKYVGFAHHLLPRSLGPDHMVNLAPSPRPKAHRVRPKTSPPQRYS